MMTERKKLIEVALPLEAINEASVREKSIRHGHPSTLHLWWARRPLAAARAVIFASLVDDPDHPNAPADFVAACRALPKGKNAQVEDTPRRRLFDFIEELVQWENTTNEKVIGTAKQLIHLATDGNPPPLLDPFAGGGSIPLEAQRLGLQAHASDLNPVAVMINKAQIEIPPRFANRPPVNPDDRAKMGSGVQWKGAAGLAADVRYYGEWMRQKAWEKIGHLYPTHNGETVIAWLWARTVKSPNPAVDVHVPLVRSFELSKKKGRNVWVEPKVEPVTKHVSFEVKEGTHSKAPGGTVDRKGGVCLVTGVPIPFDYIRTEARAGRMGAQLMAIVTEGNRGRNYYGPTVQQQQLANVDIPDEAPNTDLPEQALGFRVQAYGMTKHKDLFTPRQLVALTTLSNLVAEAREQAYTESKVAGLNDDDIPLRDGGGGARAYAESISLYLAFSLSKAGNLGSALTSWMGDRGALRETFARQTLSMVWDYAEANPFSDSGGNFNLFVERISDVIAYFNLSNLIGSASQQDAINLATSRDNCLVSTDPPYYDNVSYADLSDFFYVWQRKNLFAIYPNEFATLLVPKFNELIAEPFRFKGRENANKHFEDGMEQVFTRVCEICPKEYPTTIYYAFKQQETVVEGVQEDLNNISSSGWETMLSGLMKAGFTIYSTWPMATEGKGRLRNLYANALASSIVLVCRPRPADAKSITRRQFVDELRRELPTALKELQSGNIAPVDLAQASIGPGMAIYSRYAQVREADGSPLTVRAALGLINQELDAYLSEQDGELDGDSRFAVAWFEQYGIREGEFGQADVLARAKNTSVEGVKQAGLVTAERGKVKLVSWRDFDPGSWDPRQDRRATIWEAVHHLIERLEHHGNQGAAMLYNRMNTTMAAEARQLAYRLYNICERKGWAEQARDYNTLVALWPDMVNDAVRLREQGIGQTEMDLGV